MKTILIPTDFSPNSENATDYAMEMNKKINAKIVLFHSYFIPVYGTDMPVEVLNDAEIREASLKTLEKLKEKAKLKFKNSDFVFDVLTSEGIIADEIAAAVEKEKIDLVVMGTKGAHGLKEVLIGTNTASVVGKVNCMVLAIPEEAKFKEIKKIVFATNYAENDFENIEAVIDFAKHYNAEVIMLHISEGDLSRSFEFNSIEHFEQRIKEDTNYEGISFKLFEGKNVEEGISLYLEEINADMIAMTNRHRNLFQRLFDRSLTKKMAYHTHIPLMTFHVKERGNYLL
ncbi:universal stress protein [soil metagenome]